MRECCVARMTAVNNELHEMHNNVISHQVSSFSRGYIDYITLLLVACFITATCTSMTCFMNVTCTSRCHEESIRVSRLVSLLD